MLNETTLKTIAKHLRLDDAAFLAAAKDEKEAEVKIPELTILTAEELTARDGNQKRLGYEEGKTAGVEQLIKDQRTKHGLTFDGKDPENFVNALREKVLADAKVEPNKQLQEKETVIVNLQKNISDLQGKVGALEGEKAAFANRAKLLGFFPSDKKTSIAPADILTLAEAHGYSFKEENGVLVTHHNGQVLRDATTQNPIAAKDWVPTYLNEQKYVVAEEQQRGGRGGGSDRTPGGTPTKMSEAKKAWEADGKSANSSEFSAHVLNLAKENQNFDMDN